MAGPSVAGKVHLLTVIRSVRFACSPPWVDSAGVVTVQGTFILDEVTCRACRRTKVFKQAMGEVRLARTYIAPD